MPLPQADWLGLCRRAAHAAREAVAGLTSTAERSVPHGEGEGGDTTLAVDKAAEDAVFGELEAFGVPLVAVSEERGEVAIGGDPPAAWVVVDPVDGSVNAKRRLPFACVSIAVASGDAHGRRGGRLRGRAGARARLVGGARRGRLLRRRAAAGARARAAGAARAGDGAARAGGRGRRPR